MFETGLELEDNAVDEGTVDPENEPMVAASADLVPGTNIGSVGTLVAGTIVSVSGDLLAELIIGEAVLGTDVDASWDLLTKLEVAGLEVAKLEVEELISDILLLVVSTTFEVAELLVETIILVGKAVTGVFEVEKKESRVIVCGHAGKTWPTTERVAVQPEITLVFMPVYDGIKTEV